MAKITFISPNFYYSIMEILELATRILLTFILSMLFGMERQRSHKPVGFGTFTFVSLGACGLALLAVNLGLDKSMGILGAAITGIGFLGAGALIKTGDKIFGANTAAAIWLFAIFGLMMGLGQYILGIVVYAFVWVTVIIDIYLERGAIGSHQKKIIIETNKIIDEDQIESVINPKKSRLISLAVDKSCNKIIFSYFVEGTKDELNKLPQKLYKKDWFQSFKIE